MGSHDRVASQLHYRRAFRVPEDMQEDRIADIHIEWLHPPDPDVAREPVSHAADPTESQVAHVPIHVIVDSEEHAAIGNANPETAHAEAVFTPAPPEAPASTTPEETVIPAGTHPESNSHILTAHAESKATSPKASPERPQCRVCYESGPDLFSPCLCGGSMALICRDCLRRQRLLVDSARCTACNYAFKFGDYRQSMCRMLYCACIALYFQVVLSLVSVLDKCAGQLAAAAISGLLVVKETLEGVVRHRDAFTNCILDREVMPYRQTSEPAWEPSSMQQAGKMRFAATFVFFSLGVYQHRGKIMRCLVLYTLLNLSYSTWFAPGWWADLVLPFAVAPRLLEWMPPIPRYISLAISFLSVCLFFMPAVICGVACVLVLLSNAVLALSSVILVPYRWLTRACCVRGQT